MNKKDLELLFEYDRWANARVLQSASELTEAQLIKDLSSSFASLRDTLVHIYIGEWLWLQRWKGISPETLPTSEDFPDLASLRTKWTLVEREQTKFISEVAEETLQKTASYVNTEGEKREYPLWQMMYQAASHSNYHRGQAATMLRQLGAKPFATDFLVFSDTRVTKELLENERRRIREDIKHYPTPVPACDAQFNYLLEERARIDRELNRLKELSKQGNL